MHVIIKIYEFRPIKSLVSEAVQDRPMLLHAYELCIEPRGHQWTGVTFSVILTLSVANMSTNTVYLAPTKLLQRSQPLHQLHQIWLFDSDSWTFCLHQMIHAESDPSTWHCVIAMQNKKAVLSQRWPRDARYTSRSWAVAEIWPFEIIQDGGGRHLQFIRIENSGIRSAVPESHTLKQNMKWIGRPVAEISPLEVFPTWRWPPSWICSNSK